MELAELIQHLTDPQAYRPPVDAVTVRQTHISVVFLAGAFAYKVKKPVHFGFVDYSSLERREHFCREEVRLNRRMAAEVYLGVVPVTREGASVRMDGTGQLVEWAVKMRRLPEEATLRDRLSAGQVGAAELDVLAQQIAAFHASATSGPHVAEHGRFAVVAGNARENFEQSADHVGGTVSRGVFDRLRDLTDAALSRWQPLIESRAARGVPRDGHGDLRLEHVYLLPGRPFPDNLVVLDCIEFNDRFRCADPVADAAFLVMDLKNHGRRDLARRFADAYFAATGDDEGRALLPLYTSYRAVVRGKVKGFKLAEREVPAAERERDRAKGRAYWLLGLSELEEPRRRPALVLVGGLPGTGKSTLARQLAERAGFHVVRSDVVRKELAGVGTADSAASPFEDGIYTPEWTEKTYTECLRRAEERLFAGERVLVDATFTAARRRRQFLDAAVGWGVPAVWLVCTADAETVRSRLANRQGDASDAGWEVYLEARRHWEPPDERTQMVMNEVATDGDPPPLEQALARLREAGLWG